jgi:hypothetical protein
MKGIQSIYLGWGNLRRAFTFDNLQTPLVVLIDGHQSAVLHDSNAMDFKKHIQELNRHLMGFTHSERMADLVRKTDKDTGAYNTIFDDYWRSA